MGLIDRLLARAQPDMNGRRRVLARVLLDERGRVQAVELRRSCGDPQVDAQAVTELLGLHYPATRLGSRTSRRWHDVAWSPGG